MRPGIQAIRLGLLALAVVLALGAIVALVCEARPGFDAGGWLVWGQETWRGDLDLNAAPSFKPLSFLFTLPYGLTGTATQTWLWTITALGGAVAAPLLAGRLAWRLSPRGDGRLGAWGPPLLAASIAAGAVATMTVGTGGPGSRTMGLFSQALTLTSDPLALAFWLLAIDRLISRRERSALLSLWLVAMARPEAWPFLVALGVWCGWRTPRLRPWVLGVLATLPLAWFLAPAICSHSWLSPGHLNLDQPTAVRGSKILGVLDRVRTLNGRAIQVEVGASILLCLIRRDRRACGLIGLGAAWTLIEVLFAWHGFSAVPRYVIEAGGPLAVVGGIGAATVVSWPSRDAATALSARFRGATPSASTATDGAVGPAGAVRPGRQRRVLCAGGLVAVLAFLVALEPFARASVDATRGIIENQRLDARELAGLQRVIDRAGGARRIRPCGTPAASLRWQTSLALALDRNVAAIAYGNPDRLRGPVVFFERHGRTGTRWTISLRHPAPRTSPSCRALDGVAD